jgi:glycosyltransferase involved in cell wall biosynthesis
VTPPLVMHVFPTFAVGGAQARFITLANRFGRNFRHAVIALDGNRAAAGRLSPDLDLKFPDVTAAKRAMLANARRFRAILQEWRPDLLVTCNWGAIEFALGNLVPIARHIHVEDGFGPEERDRQMRRRVVLRRLALARSLVVLPSRSLARIATEVWRLRRVRYLPNGVDLMQFAPTAARAAGPVTIGTVAALRPEKQIARLIGAFARIASDSTSQLVIVGDGPQRAALEAQVATAGLTDRVAFLGHREDTAEFYHAFDIFALSSDTEQMPLSVLEAMASGLPVVATDVGDVATMLSSRNRAFVTARDEVALAGALGTLAGDAALRAQLGSENRRRAELEFDQDVMVTRWRALWDGTAPAA